MRLKLKSKLLFSFFLVIIFNNQSNASAIEAKTETSDLLNADEQTFDIVFENLSRDEVIKQLAHHASCFAGNNEITTKNDTLIFRTVDNIEISISLWNISGFGTYGLKFEYLMGKEPHLSNYDAFLNYKTHFIDHLGPLDINLEGLEHFYLDDHSYYRDVLESDL